MLLCLEGYQSSKLCFMKLMSLQNKILSSRWNNNFCLFVVSAPKRPSQHDIKCEGLQQADLDHTILYPHPLQKDGKHPNAPCFPFFFHTLLIIKLKGLKLCWHSFKKVSKAYDDVDFFEGRQILVGKSH